MLKRRQMPVDLKNNVLKIYGDSIPFISGAKLGKSLRKIADTEQSNEGLEGTLIGASTGVAESKELTGSPMPTSAPSYRVKNPYTRFCK